METPRASIFKNQPIFFAPIPDSQFRKNVPSSYKSRTHEKPIFLIPVPSLSSWRAHFLHRALRCDIKSGNVVNYRDIPRYFCKNPNSAPSESKLQVKVDSGHRDEFGGNLARKTAIRFSVIRFKSYLNMASLESSISQRRVHLTWCNFKAHHLSISETAKAPRLTHHPFRLRTLNLIQILCEMLLPTGWE